MSQVKQSFLEEKKKLHFFFFASICHTNLFKIKQQFELFVRLAVSSRLSCN